MEALSYKMDLRLGRDAVWERFTSGPGLCSWLCQRATFEAVVGGRVDLEWDVAPGRGGTLTEVRGRVLSIDRPRLLTFSWLGAVRGVFCSTGETEVMLDLFPTPEGTRVELSHLGWSGGDASLAERDRVDRLWWSALERLRAAVRLSPRASVMSTVMVRGAAGSLSRRSR